MARALSHISTRRVSPGTRIMCALVSTVVFPYLGIWDPVRRESELLRGL